jgi:hypothetical protein
MIDIYWLKEEEEEEEEACKAAFLQKIRICCLKEEEALACE